MRLRVVILTTAVLWLVPNVSRAVEELPPPTAWSVPQPEPATPGGQFVCPIDMDRTPANDAPVVFEHTQDAGPDRSFLAVGRRLSERVLVWGCSGNSADGEQWPVKVQLAQESYLAATMDARTPDGPAVVWLGNEAGWSRPIRLNVPRVWWTWPENPVAGGTLRVFGRDLSRRPDRTTAFVYLTQPGKTGRWLDVTAPDKYEVKATLPKDLTPGEYQLWVHAGAGGRFGWGGPIAVTVAEAPSKASVVNVGDATRSDLQKAIDEVAKHGGGVLRLDAGVYHFRGTLKIPANVQITGAGAERTRLQLVYSDRTEFARPAANRWDSGATSIHTPGDTIDYTIRLPHAGRWIVWIRYATEMSKWNLPGVSGHMTLQLGNNEPVPMQNLPNTGTFSTFKWSKTAVIESTNAAPQRLRWKNEKGGGLHIDALLMTRDENYEPEDHPEPKAGQDVVLIQGEDVTDFKSKDGRLPGSVAAAVWLAGDGAALTDLTVSGNEQVNVGVMIRSPNDLEWVRGCRLDRCNVRDVSGGVGSDNRGVWLVRAESATVRECEIWAGASFYLSAVRCCDLSANRLVATTRGGRNALAAILGRTDVIERCIVEDNVIASPPGAEAGGPQVMRMIWVSTGHGSVTHNLFARNAPASPAAPTAPAGAGSARFGAVAGNDQNVGEMILFEANHRTMFFGTLTKADTHSATLPATVPPTPDDVLGSVKREQLAHDAEGNETPFWPPDADDGTAEPPIDQYFVTVFDGPGQGQTRRVVRREKTELILDRPWRVPPAAGSVVVVGTGYYQNLVLANHTRDGMTGIQLWISCIENVVAGNTIARVRKPAIFMFAHGTTLASSMPRTWNRGLAPLLFNHIEGNSSDEASAGILVTSGDYAGIPIQFPRALGNVLRHNTMIRSRSDGVIIRSRRSDADEDTSPSVLGTVVEHNVVRDAQCAYHAGSGADGIVFHRNHAYFWYPVNNAPEPPAAFQIDRPDAKVAIDKNTIEGIHGTGVSPQTVVPLVRPENQ